MIKTEIQPIIQSANETTCGLCCVAMVLQLADIEKHVVQIAKDLNTETEGTGTSLVKINRYLLEAGVDTEYWCKQSMLFSEGVANLSRKALARYCTKRQKSSELSDAGVERLKLIKDLLVHTDAKIKVGRFNPRYFRNHMMGNNLAIVSVDKVALYGYRSLREEVDEINGETTTHAVLVDGYSPEECVYHILDSRVNQRGHSYFAPDWVLESAMVEARNGENILIKNPHQNMLFS